MKPVVSQPVEVTNPEPLPVEVFEAPDTAAESKARTVVATARADADILRTEDQRRISGMWERTQQVIALSVVESSLVAILFIVWRGENSQTQLGLTVLFGMANLVIGFYFGRTNHTRVGGAVTQAEEFRGRS